jgi:hypothetical protein
MFRLLRWLLLALLLGLGALLLPEAQSEEDLERAAAQLRTTCTRQADVLRSLSLSVAADSTSRWDRSTTELIDQSRQGIEVMVWEADMLRYWTGTAALNRPSITGAGHVVGADGTYLVHVTNTGDRTVMAAQRIWYSPPFENRYLRKGFNPVLDTPAGLEAALGPGVGPVVRDGSDRVMFRLQWGDAGGAGMPWGRIVMLLLALAFLLRFLWLATEALAAQRGGWIAFLVLAAVLAGLRWISLLSGLSDLLGDLPLFNPALYAASFLPRRVCAPRVGARPAPAFLVAHCRLGLRRVVGPRRGHQPNAHRAGVRQQRGPRPVSPAALRPVQRGGVDRRGLAARCVEHAGRWARALAHPIGLGA